MKYLIPLAVIIGFGAGWATNDYFNKPETKEVIKEIIRVDTVKVPPIIRNVIQWRTQLPQDPNEPTTFRYIFDEDSIKFTVVIESQIEPMDIRVTDFIVTPSQIVLTDTLKVKVTEYYEKNDSISGYKTITLVTGSTIAGYNLAKENYVEAGIVAGITGIIYIFWDEIERVWKWTQKLFM